jgi:hypothetical protein
MSIKYITNNGQCPNSSWSKESNTVINPYKYGASRWKKREHFEYFRAKSYVGIHL